MRLNAVSKMFQLVKNIPLWVHKLTIVLSALDNYILYVI